MTKTIEVFKYVHREATDYLSMSLNQLHEEASFYIIFKPLFC